MPTLTMQMPITTITDKRVTGNSTAYSCAKNEKGRYFEKQRMGEPVLILILT